jgi:hypothetical protein
MVLSWSEEKMEVVSTTFTKRKMDEQKYLDLG